MKKLLLGIMALSVTFAQAVQTPQVYTENMTASEAAKVDAANQLVNSAEQSYEQARAALQAALKARSDAAGTIQLAHGNAIGAWQKNDDGSLTRPAHVVEIRGHMLIHSVGVDTCPAQDVRSSGPQMICSASSQK